MENVKAYINNNGGEFLLGFDKDANASDITKAIIAASKLANAEIDMVEGKIAINAE